MPLRPWNRKKPRHQRDTTVTHNSVFAALHRLNAGWRLHLTIRHFFFTSEDSLRRRGDSRQTGPALSLSRTGFQPVGAKRESTSRDAHRPSQARCLASGTRGFRGERDCSGERTRLGRWFRRLAETIFWVLKVREPGTASPAPETDALPRFCRARTALKARGLRSRWCIQ